MDFPVADGGRTYNVVIIGGGLQDDARLVYNANNPEIGDIWAATIKKWQSYPCDVFLGAHSWFLQPDRQVQEAAGQPAGQSVH